MWLYTVRAGDTLISVSRAHLRDPRQWPVIQRINGVTDPTRLPIGRVLRIPLALMPAFDGTAEPLWVRGDVRVISADGASRALVPGDAIPAGSRLETGADSGVRLRLVDGAIVTLGERSRLDLRELTVYSHSVPRTRLEIDRGRLESIVTPASAPGTRYEIKTPVVTTAVRGTDFRVHVDETGTRARAEVVSGAVAAQLGTTSVALDAGFGLAAAAGEPPGGARPLPPAPDLATVVRRAERMPVRAAWTPAPGVRRHRVRLAEVPGDRTVHEQVIDAAEVRWADLADGRYTLRVRSIDASELEGADVTATIDVHARPEPPIAGSPNEGSRGYGASVDFTWTRSDSAETYDVQVATEPGFASPVVDVTGRAENSLSQALAPGAYHWRVASRTAALGRGPFSDPSSFTLSRVPDGRHAEGLIEKKTITLRWTSGLPGERSHVQLANDRDFTRVVVDRTIPESSMSLPRPAPGTYFVRVRAIDEHDTPGPYGPTQSFTVPEEPRRRRWWPWLIPPAVAGTLLILFL